MNNKYLRLTDSYVVRNDSNGSFLIKANSLIPELRNREIIAIPNFIGYIIERLGYMPYKESVRTISNQTNISESILDRFVCQLIDNPVPKKMVISAECSVEFPSKILVWSDTVEKRRFYVEDDFDWTRDFLPSRPTMPVNVNLMTTTKCSTDCVYCYANKHLSNNLNIEEFDKILADLHSGGCVNITLTGGDLFSFPEWKRLLSAVRNYHYNPYISTKTPLGRDDLISLRNLDYEEFQFSLDSHIISNLSVLLKVDGQIYFDRVCSMLNICSEMGINVKIRSVLTSINCDYTQMRAFYDFLCGYSCIKGWDMTPAFYSEYKSHNYDWLAPDNENLIKIRSFTLGENKFPISLNKVGIEGYVSQRYSNVYDFVKYNQVCLANYYGISILSNGLCTVCEMLYDVPEYLLGDVRNSSIRSIWNSDKALKLYNLCQADLEKETPCKNCDVFTECKASPLKRVCYLNIHKTKGSFEDPDPCCPLANPTDLIL